MRSYSLLALAGLSVSVLLTGCGFGSEGVELGYQASGFSGQMMGGQAPVTGATLTIYTFGTAGYGLGGSAIATTTTDNSGNYNFSNFTCPQSNTPVYMIGSGGNTGGGNNPSAVLAVTLGPCGSITGPIAINEVTTVAAAFTLAHYFNEINTGYTAGADFFGGPSSTTAGVIIYSQGIVNATTITIPHIVNTSFGGTNSNVNASPGSIVEAAKINTIANILAACVNTTGPTSNTETTTVCGKLFGYTMDYSNVRPFDTLQAAVQMALYPAVQVKNLYNLIPPIGFSFSNYLLTAPQDFSIGISYTTPNAGLIVPTNSVTTLDIDTHGNVWFPSNGPGQIGIVRFYPVGSTGFDGPFNTTSMAYPTQVAIDNAGYAWLNDRGTGIVSGYQTSIPPNPPNSTSFGLTNTATTAVTANDDGSIVFGFLLGGAPSLSSINPARTTYAPIPNSALDFAAVSVAGDAVGGDGVTTTNTSAGFGMSLYYDGPSSGNTAVKVGADAGKAGQVIFQGEDFVSINTGATSAADNLCVFSVQTCYAIYPQTQRPTNVVIDGNSSLWVTAGAAAALMEIPQYSTFAPGGTSYLDTNFHPSRAEAYEFFHGSGNGGTMVQPAGIGVDVAGNVWISNAGCTTTGCTPTPFVLSEVIGAAAPTITPVVNQIITNSTLTGTEPNY